MSRRKRVRSRDFQASTKSSDEEIMETFVYTGFFDFHNSFLVSNLVSLCLESSAT